MGINWKWNDTYTTTTTTGDPIKINAPEWKVGDKVEINSPIDIGVVGEPKGWVCPRCGRVNAPWVSQCSCNGNIYIKVNTQPISVPLACTTCPNHPSNGGSGNCNCILGTPQVTC